MKKTGGKYEKSVGKAYEKLILGNLKKIKL